METQLFADLQRIAFVVGIPPISVTVEYGYQSENVCARDQLKQIQMVMNVSMHKQLIPRLHVPNQHLQADSQPR